MNTNLRGKSLAGMLRGVQVQRGMAFGVIILTALFAFEIFNYSTTEFALSDLLGGLKFASVSWATILAIAFCGIDFAGIARLFTPEQNNSEPNEVWYLFGAWLLAASMNALLTWWGVSIAIVGHQSLGSAVVSSDRLLRVVPVFVAVLVWLIRVLIIGTFSVAGNRLFSQAERQGKVHGGSYQPKSNPQPSFSSRGQAPRYTTLGSFRSAPKQSNQSAEPGYLRQEPTYHSLSGTRSKGMEPVEAKSTYGGSRSNERQ